MSIKIVFFTLYKNKPVYKIINSAFKFCFIIYNGVSLNYFAEIKKGKIKCKNRLCYSFWTAGDTEKKLPQIMP